MIFILRLSLIELKCKQTRISFPCQVHSNNDRCFLPFVFIFLEDFFQSPCIFSHLLNLLKILIYTVLGSSSCPSENIHSSPVRLDISPSKIKSPPPSAKNSCEEIRQNPQKICCKEWWFLTTRKDSH